jgi:O-methyltransferase involved in polyketide biosynthesis
MLSSDPAAAALDVSLSETMITLAKRLMTTETPESIADDALAQLLAATVRLYAARFQQGCRTRAFGPGGHDVTATDVMITTTAMLQAVNVQLFELGMWQAWTGTHALPAEGRSHE